MMVEDHNNMLNCNPTTKAQYAINTCRTPLRHFEINDELVIVHGAVET